ncbi:MAG TPA: response regulator [Kofleriaceae bacterium]
MIPEASAIAIAPRGASSHLKALLDRLAANGMKVTLVDELGAAAAVAVQTPEAPPCVLLDLEAGEEVEDRRRAVDELKKISAAIPHVLPIAILTAADSQMILACIRAGAGDVLDVRLEGTANARAIIHRVFERQTLTARSASQANHLRGMVEDLLKDLIKTERRSLALEDEKVAVRDPAVLIVERDRQLADQLADRLETAGVTSYAYITGDDAVRAATRLEIDLAVVACSAAIDGVETVRRLREKSPSLPAYLLTEQAELADGAAELGVVGYVQKPVPDLPYVVGRVAQLAKESLGRTREQTYLERIKERHERVLARYRSLPRD